MPDIAMTPGNKRPGRYRKTTLSAGLVALIATGASFPTLYDRFLDEKEGNWLTAYRDGKGIWTICRGLTRIDGIPVKRGDQLTPAQCDFYNREHASEAEREMEKRMGPRWQTLSTPAKVGIASWCWTNLGWEKCSRQANGQPTTFMQLWRSGAPANDYCAQITRWIYDAGRDCRKAGSNCQGQPVRRMQEDELCLIPKENANADQTARNL
jgi:lysozyme